MCATMPHRPTRALGRSGRRCTRPRAGWTVMRPGCCRVWLSATPAASTTGWTRTRRRPASPISSRSRVLLASINHSGEPLIRKLVRLALGIQLVGGGSRLWVRAVLGLDIGPTNLTVIIDWPSPQPGTEPTGDQDPARLLERTRVARQPTLGDVVDQHPGAQVD